MPGVDAGRTGTGAVQRAGGVMPAPWEQLEDGPAPTLGHVLRAQAPAITQHILTWWHERADPAMSRAGYEEIERDIVRAIEAGKFAVADYLVTGRPVTREQSEVWEATGEAPLKETISLSELTKMYLLWRQEVTRVVREVAPRLEVKDAALGAALQAILIGSDLSIVRMAKRFEASRRELERQLAEKQLRLEHQALHDPLTGLANRQLTVDRAEQMLLRSRRSDDPVALCFIDLDNFKETNDSLGHEAGDRLLCAAAARLTRILRAADTVGRLGGDEFVILTEGPSLADGPLFVAERIRDALAEPFELEGYEGLPITVTASVGIATGDRPSAQELLRDADVALYQAKAAGKDCCVLFEPEMQSAAVNRLALKSNLYSALDRDQFFLLYQPIFDLDTMVVRGVEALLRWRHPTRGVIGPNEFIPVLEESGLILGVGGWVLSEATAQAARWRGDGLALAMSVNVSMRQLASADLVGDVEGALAASGLDPGALTLEVTESVLMRDADATVARLESLKEVGVAIAIDDFGSGQSSLTYLRRFPIDELKIDGSFVAALDGSHESSALLHTMVELGQTLGLATVAEGIETCDQLEGLRHQNCRYGQGFIFAKPQDPLAIEELLAQGPLAVGPAPAPAPRA
jgi:diguanylate cyclase (GGDEF)-like protein